MASFDDVRDLFEAPNIGFAATINRSGAAHVNPVWCDVENGHIVLNSSAGRTWVANADRDGCITLAIADRGNPYRYGYVRGRIAGRSTEDGLEVIDRLARKYLGTDRYPWLQPGEVRITYRLEPAHVYHQNAG